MLHINDMCTTLLVRCTCVFGVLFCIEGKHTCGLTRHEMPVQHTCLCLLAKITKFSINLWAKNVILFTDLMLHRFQLTPPKAFHGSFEEYGGRIWPLLRWRKISNVKSQCGSIWSLHKHTHFSIQPMIINSFWDTKLYLALILVSKLSEF